jgi:hypothetical protein
LIEFDAQEHQLLLDFIAPVFPPDFLKKLPYLFVGRFGLLEGAPGGYGISEL